MWAFEMMNRHSNKQNGAAALITTMVMSTIIVLVVLSMFRVTINVNNLHQSYEDSMKRYYYVEAGLQDALFQLKKEPSNLIFTPFTIASTTVDRLFVDTGCVSDCPSVVEGQSSSTKSTERLQYYCENDLSGCRYERLIP